MVTDHNPGDGAQRHLPRPGTKLATAGEMLDAGTPKSIVAKTIGVSRLTLYAHLAKETRAN